MPFVSPVCDREDAWLTHYTPAKCVTKAASEKDMGKKTDKGDGEKLLSPPQPKLEEDPMAMASLWYWKNSESSK